MRRPQLVLEWRQWPPRVVLPDRTAWLWQQIAARYRNNSTVAAYGLLNEPWGTNANTLANNLYFLAQQVRSVDPTHIIILHGHTSGIGAFGNPANRGFSNMAFEMHFYPGIFGWRDNDDPTVVHSDWLHSVHVNIVAACVD